VNILITGASGFVGSPLIRALATQGYTGVATSRRAIKSMPASWSWRQRDDVLKGAVSNPRFDGIIHLEVKQHVFAPTMRDLKQLVDVNVQGTGHWLAYCTAHHIRRFVYFSSTKAVIATGDEVSESAPGAAAPSYGRTKWQGEELVRKWSVANPQRAALILRPAVVYGPGNVANVADMVRAIDRNRFFLIGANRNVKSMVSVRNVAAAVVHLLAAMQPGSCEVFNLVDAKSYSVREIDGMIRRSLGKQGNSPTLPIALARSAAIFGDAVHRFTGRSFPINSNRLDALLGNTHFSGEKLLGSGFKHPQSTEEGLAEMVAWCRTDVPTA